jgi:hypothetical protein
MLSINSLGMLARNFMLNIMEHIETNYNVIAGFVSNTSFINEKTNIKYDKRG